MYKHYTRGLRLQEVTRIVEMKCINEKIYITCRRTDSMPYTEIKQRNGNKYYYRAISVRDSGRIGKKRDYLGKDLSKEQLSEKEAVADKSLLKIKRDKTITKVKSKVLPILKKYKIKKAGIFGSYARGEQRKDSDVDIVVVPAKGMGFRFAGMEIDLEKSLKKKVDLITYKSINKYLRRRILSEEVRIL